MKTVKIEETAQIETSTILLEKLNEYNSYVKSIEGNALVMYKESDVTYSFRAQIESDKDKMDFKLQLDDFVFKFPLFTLIKKDQDVLAIVHSNKTYTFLQYEELDLNILTGLNIPHDILIRGVLGEVFVIKGEIIESKAQSITIQNKNQSETIVFNKELLPDETHYYLNPELDMYKVTFSKYRNVENIEFPYKINIQNEEKTLSINYSDVKINTPISTDVFSMDISHLEDYTPLN
jgi:hypothetical protein